MDVRGPAPDARDDRGKALALGGPDRTDVTCAPHVDPRGRAGDDATPSTGAGATGWCCACPRSDANAWVPGSTLDGAYSFNAATQSA